MKPESDQMEVLRRMRREGRISREEFENLTGGLSSPSPVAAREAAEPDITPGPTTDLESEAGVYGDPDTPRPRATPTLREDLSSKYIGGLAIAAVALFGASALGMLSWWITISVVMVLATTLFDGWGKVTVLGAAVVAGVFVISLVASTLGNPDPEPTVAATVPPPDPSSPIPGSLGIYMDQVSDLWNTVDTSPRITKGLTRYNETGEYDTFIYRFGDWGSVAGAFDPENEAIYALLVTGEFSEPATSQLYLHTCYVVAPYSQECIDSFFEQGLEGGTLEDFVDVVHEAQWTLGDHSWSFETGGNVMAIRVYGADAT